MLVIVHPLLHLRTSPPILGTTTIHLREGVTATQLDGQLDGMLPFSNRDLSARAYIIIVRTNVTIDS